MYSKVFRFLSQSVTKKAPSFAFIMSVKQMYSNPFASIIWMEVSCTISFFIAFFWKAKLMKMKWLCFSIFTGKNRLFSVFLNLLGILLFLSYATSTNNFYTLSCCALHCFSTLWFVYMANEYGIALTIWRWLDCSHELFFHFVRVRFSDFFCQDWTTSWKNWQLVFLEAQGRTDCSAILIGFGHEFCN